MDTDRFGKVNADPFQKKFPTRRILSKAAQANIAPLTPRHTGPQPAYITGQRRPVKLQR